MAKISKVEGNLYEFGSPLSGEAAAETFESPFLQGLEAEKTGKTDEALGFYRQVLALNPQATGALVNIGTIAFSRRQWAVAEECYRQALEVDPCYPLAHYNLGCCLLEKWPPSRKEAIKHLQEALGLKPDYADAHYNLALELGRNKKTRREALRHWRLYMRHSDSDDPYRDYARSEMALMRHLKVVSMPVVRNRLKKHLSDSSAG